jgi:hypothetical protein
MACYLNQRPQKNNIILKDGLYPSDNIKVTSEKVLFGLYHSNPGGKNASIFDSGNNLSGNALAVG